MNEKLNEAIILGHKFDLYEGTNTSDKTLNIQGREIPVSELAGGIEYGSREIFVKHDDSFESKKLTLCHELAHAYLYLTGVQEEMSMRVYEKWSSFIAMCMIDLIKNNPKIVAVIQQEKPKNSILIENK